MKKLAAVFLWLIMIAVPFRTDATEQPAVSAESYVLYCPQNGCFLLSKAPDKRMKPASTTKLMTTLLTLEEAAKNDRVITFTEKMQAEGSSMYLKFGEKLRLSDLAAGMMMCSGNDAANACAIGISGSAECFAVLMNEKCARLGMKNTHFVTPSGLDDEEHYTTATDMAYLMAAALKNSSFRELTSQKRCSVSFVYPENKKTAYSNHNRLLSLYPYCTGGKTGYTEAAGRCLVSSAKKDGVELICVTLNDRDDWNDHQRLYDYGFTSLKHKSYDGEKRLRLPCVGGDKDSVWVYAPGDSGITAGADEIGTLTRKIYADGFLYAPVKKGQRVGQIEYSCGGKTLKTAPLVADEEVKIQTAEHGFWQWIKELFKHG